MVELDSTGFDVELDSTAGISELKQEKTRKYEPPHDKTNKMACAPSEDSDQPGHPPSLISLAKTQISLGIRPV